MTLSFKEAYDFKSKILCGSKIHSIRVDPHKRWRPGITINMVTGNRTKARFEFKTAVCTSIQQISVTGSRIIIDGRVLQGREVSELISNDGFESELAFNEFFKGGVAGVLIHWTGKRY